MIYASETLPRKRCHRGTSEATSCSSWPRPTPIALGTIQPLDRLLVMPGWRLLSAPSATSSTRLQTLGGPAMATAA